MTGWWTGVGRCVGGSAAQPGLAQSPGCGDCHCSDCLGGADAATAGGAAQQPVKSERPSRSHHLLLEGIPACCGSQVEARLSLRRHGAGAERGPLPSEAQTAAACQGPRPLHPQQHSFPQGTARFAAQQIRPSAACSAKPGSIRTAFLVGGKEAARWPGEFRGYSPQAARLPATI